MDAFSIDRIRPLICHETYARGQLDATFRCPLTDEEITASVPLPGPQEDPDTRDRALRDAFAQVAHRFIWDRAAERYIAVGDDPAREFRTLVAQADVRHRRDRNALSRILAEVAAADGRLDADERLFFSVFTGRSEDDLDGLATRRPLTDSELARIPGKLREPFLMFALALAHTDGEYAPEERARIEIYRRAFGVDHARGEALEAAARSWILEQELEHLYSMGHPDTAEHAHALHLAQRLGMEPEEFQRLETRFLVRRGWLDRRGPHERHHADERRRARTSARSILRGRDHATCISDWAAPGALGDAHSRYE